jgi:DivIVA domain-containing protein
MTTDEGRRPVSDLTPSQIAAANFSIARRGYDVDEVDHFLADVAHVVDKALSQATAMEARARAAVARLNEQPATADKAVGEANAETITRTLLMAQRAADAAVEEARADADRIRTEATAESERLVATAEREAKRVLGDARTHADEVLALARDGAREATEEERRRAEDEVRGLLARREVLLGDVDLLEQFLIEQRERLRGTARQLEVLCERIPGGLGSVRMPAVADPGDPVPASGTPSGAEADAAVPEAAVPEAAVPDAADPDDEHDGGSDRGPDEPESADPVVPHVGVASRAEQETAPIERPVVVDSPDGDQTSAGGPVVPRLPDQHGDRPTAEELGTLRLEIAALVDSSPVDSVGEFDDTGEFEPTTELRLPPT